MYSTDEGLVTVTMEREKSELKDAPFIWIKSTEDKVMGIIYTIVLLRKRQGFAARKDFIPIVQQQGCVLWAPEAQQAQHTWPAVWAVQCDIPGLPCATHCSPALRAALAPAGLLWVQPGGSWRALYQVREHFITDFQGLSRTGRMMGLFLDPAGSEKDATEETKYLPVCLIFNLNLSVALAHLVNGINVTSRLLRCLVRHLWCTQDVCQPFPIPVPGWEECPHSKNPWEPMLQQLLQHHSPTSTHTGWQKAYRLSRNVCELKRSLFWKLLFWRCLLKT